MLAAKHENGEATVHLSGRLLNPSTMIANDNKRERIIKEAILELADTGLLAWYEFYTMQAPNSIKGWKVDFATNLVYFDGKMDRLVVIEPHGSFNEDESEKIRKIREAYGLFVILISKREPRLASVGDPSRSVKFFDRYWQMPNHLDNVEREKEEKLHMKKMLVAFIKDSMVHIVSKEEAQQMLLERISTSMEYERVVKEALRKN